MSNFWGFGNATKIIRSGDIMSPVLTIVQTTVAFDMPVLQVSDLAVWKCYLQVSSTLAVN